MKFPFPVSPEECGGNRLITFVSLLPGDGATSLACMTAAGLGKDTALVDLSSAGKVRAYTGTTTDVCAASVLDASAARAYEDIRTVGVDHPDGVYIIPGPVRLLDRVDAGVAIKVARACKHVFKYTVAVSGMLSYTGWGLVMQSDIIVMVVNPNRCDLDVFHENMEFLARLDAAERTVVVLNQARQPGGMENKAVVEYFKPAVIVPHNVNILKACNQRRIFAMRPKAGDLIQCLTAR